MFGWGYVIDFCIALFQKEQQEKATAIYFAECARLICENTAKMVGGEFVPVKLKDILDGTKEDDRSASDIIETIRNKLENTDEAER